MQTHSFVSTSCPSLSESLSSESQQSLNSDVLVCLLRWRRISFPSKYKAVVSLALGWEKAIWYSDFFLRSLVVSFMESKWVRVCLFTKSWQSVKRYYMSLQNEKNLIIQLKCFLISCWIIKYWLVINWRVENELILLKDIYQDHAPSELELN